MKLIIGFVALIVIAVGSFGQSKSSSKRFTLPKNATPADYHNGVLLAKLKPIFRSLASSQSSGRTQTIPDVIVRPLANPGAVAQNKSSRTSNNYQIDLSLYVQLFITPGSDIEARINELYATGYFEIIEPVYVDKMDVNPNDSFVSEQYYLGLIHAFEGWDISQSDNGTVIAIVDSGGDLVHPDLVGNLYINPDEIPNNNLDDDGDGYIDNVNGWDFVGADTLNIFNSGFIGDNNPQLVQGFDIGALGHGVWVAGCASAATNNSVGIAGVGFKSRLLFTKHTADNQKVKAPSIYSGYAGILYAAQTLTADNVSRKIINCSWGGSFRSQIAQDLITHVTLDLGCLVVAAAGNDNSSSPNYPSSYDNVLSVVATDKNDLKASFSNYGTTVDLSAPGVSIFTTAYLNNYAVVSGTSFSSPITAGAASLVWSKNPGFTPLQVAEQLRVTADNIDALNPFIPFQPLGSGRINIKNALTLSLPSIKASKPTLLNAQGIAAQLGQPTFLTFDFKNYLKSSSNGLTVTASSTSGLVTFSTSQVPLGIINEGATVRNAANPVKLTIIAGVDENTMITIKLTYSDGLYSDVQFVDLILNPSYITADENTITTSIASKGRIGFDDPDNQRLGAGFVVKDNSLLFEMGLMMGTSASNLFSNVRGINGAFDQDFTEVTSIQEIVPGLRSTSEIFGSFAPTTLSSLLISYRSLVMRDSPNDKFIILEYTLKNTSAIDINNFRFGIFADWDISSSGGQDAAGWDQPHKIGYVYPKQSTNLPHAGIQVLNMDASYYAIDNNQTIAGNPFGLYDGFTKDEKFTALSQARLTAGETTTNGNDVSHVVSVSPFTIASGGQVVIAFALHSANNLTELLASADAANTLYNLTFSAPKPSVVAIETCFGANATLNATGVSSYKWYKNFTGGSSIQTGPQITTANLFGDTTLYVSNAANVYESVRALANVKVKANPKITGSGSSQICDGQSVGLSVSASDVYTWSTGEATQNINVKTTGNYSVTVKYNALNCTSVSTPFSVTVSPSPVAQFSSSGDLVVGNSITFSDQSINAASWLWSFGEGTTSSNQNPAHKYAATKSYLVSLTVTANDGCVGSVSKPLDVITGLENPSTGELFLYPNPTSDYLTIRFPNTLQSSVLTMINMQGQLMLHTTLELDSEGNQKVFIGGFSDGVYLVKINSETRSFTRKVVIKH